MPTYLVRVWLPDRPGALGQVASRIGAVRGDVVGIEILERGGGRAIDELVVALPEDGLLDLLVAEISQVDGVDVEDVRTLGSDRHDPGLTALAHRRPAGRGQRRRRRAEAPLRAHRGRLRVRLGGGAATGPGRARSSPSGDAPSAAWVAAFVHGSRHLDANVDGDAGPDDVAWADLPTAGLALAVGRKGRPFRWRERRQLATLARIADRYAGGASDRAR